MNTLLKALATFVVVICTGFGVHAAWSLGAGWYSVLFGIFIVGALCYEFWIAPVREAAYREEILKEIEDLRIELENINAPGNLQDAKDIVRGLKKGIVTISDAYVEIYDENKELKARLDCGHELEELLEAEKSI